MLSEEKIETEEKVENDLVTQYGVSHGANYVTINLIHSIDTLFYSYWLSELTKIRSDNKSIRNKNTILFCSYLVLCVLTFRVFLFLFTSLVVIQLTVRSGTLTE